MQHHFEILGYMHWHCKNHYRKSEQISKMMKIRVLSSYSGYTLVETVVAMAIFLSVLLPLVESLGTMMFDKRTMVLHRAFVDAQSAMVATIAAQDYSESTQPTSDGFIIAKTIRREGSIVDVRVAVRTSGEQSKELVVLKRFVSTQ